MMSGKAIAVATLMTIATLAQFYPTTVHDNAETTAEIAASPEIRRVLRRACYDCHSNETRWPWYSYVAPASWLVTADVHEARQRMNFSDWPRSAPPEVNCYFKRRIAERAANGEMPPLRYRFLHPSAEVSAEEAAKLQSWAAEGCAHHE